jgi:hypothetical protein
MKNLMWAALAIALAATTGLTAQQPTPQEKPAGTAGTTAAEPQAAPDVPGGELSLGSVRIPRAVMADGKALKAGTYQVRLTGQEARPDAIGQTEKLERWAELIQGGQARGREVVTIVPGAEIQQVADGRPPRPGASKVELLKGGDYLRVWINRGGTHYLIHLPVATTT